MSNFKCRNGVVIEMTPEEVDSITPNYSDVISSKRKELLDNLERDLQSNAIDIASAIAEDGVNEAGNILTLRTQRSDIKAKFQTEMLALLTGGSNQ